MTNWQMKDTLLSVCSHTDISLNASQKHTGRPLAELGEGRGGQGAQSRAARCGGGPPRHVPRCSVRKTDVLKWVQSCCARLSEGLAYRSYQTTIRPAHTYSSFHPHRGSLPPRQAVAPFATGSLPLAFRTGPATALAIVSAW